jgi:Bor protein
MIQYLSCGKPVTLAWLLASCFFFSSCYSYRVATHAQEGTETVATTTAHSLFWGLVKKPKEIHTPICDSLEVNGMSEVVIKNNFGYSLITVATLGIWCPIKLEWKCAKPCKKCGTL